MTNDLITSKEACELLQVHRTTLYKWRKQGLVKWYSFENTRKVYYKKSELLEDLITRK